MAPPRLHGRAGQRARRLATLLLTLITCTWHAPGALAQTPTDTVVVAGTVRDATQAVVPGTTVEALVAGRRIAVATTAENGRYQLAIPRNVRFELRARRAGFAEFVADMPGTRDPAAHDIVLETGGVSDTLVVTASGNAASRTHVTSSVSVMTAADLDALAVPSVAEALRFVPALSVDGNGREGSFGSVFARGGNANYNLVLIDGVRANQNGGAFYDLSRVPAAAIDRIEVVRGAQSALWGSDAIGSVVQIFTKRGNPGDAPQISGSVMGGSFGTRRGDTRITGGAGGRIDYSLGVTHRATSGAFADRLPEDDTFEQTTIDAGLGTTLGARASLRTGVRVGNAQGKSVGPLAYGARNTGGSYDTRDVTWHLSVPHAVGSRFTGTATVNYYRYRSVSADRVGDPAYPTYAVLEGMPGARFPRGVRLVRTVNEEDFNTLMAAGALPTPGQFLATALSFDFSPFESVTEFRRPAVRYQGDYTWAPGQRLSAGYEWERESNPLVAAEQLDNHALFVQQQFSAGDRLFVTVGARIDDKESHDSYFSPKLSAGGVVLPARAGAVSSLRVFGNLGKGIKTPLFSERLGAPWADPNPGLKVERARSADIGVEATFVDQTLRAAITYFHNDYHDQIAYRFGPVGDGVPEFLNINGSRAEGWEIDVALQRPVAGFTAAGTYAFVDTEVVTNLNTGPSYRPGEPLLRRPKHSGSLRVSYAAGRRAGLHMDARFVGVRHDSGFLFLQTVPNAERPESVNTDITVNPGYAVMGAGADVRLRDELTVFVRADNIGNATYEHALGYPGLPRSAMAGVRFSIGGR